MSCLSCVSCRACHACHVVRVGACRCVSLLIVMRIVHVVQVMRVVRVVRVPRTCEKVWNRNFRIYFRQIFFFQFFFLVNSVEKHQVSSLKEISRRDENHGINGSSDCGLFKLTW